MVEDTITDSEAVQETLEEFEAFFDNTIYDNSDHEHDGDIYITAAPHEDEAFAEAMADLFEDIEYVGFEVPTDCFHFDIETPAPVEKLRSALDMSFVDTVEAVDDQRVKVAADNFWQDRNDISRVEDAGFEVKSVRSNGGSMDVEVWFKYTGE